MPPERRSAGAQIFGIDVGGSGGRPQNATSDADGKFRLDGFVAERAILVNVSAPGYATLQKNVTPPAADLVIVLKTAGTVRGRVEDGDTKKPVTDFTISRSGARGGGGGIQIAIGRGGGDQTFQSDDGTFELTDVPPGKWTIRGAAAGYRSAETSGVEVGEGETKEGVVLSLKKGGGLSGRVTDPRGTAVANASVAWHPAESGGGPMGAAMARMMGGGGGGGSTTSDADGHFQFDGLPDARVTVTASHPDYLDASRDIDPSKETAVDLSLGTGASISGTVVGSDGRSAVPGALVQLNEEGSSGGGFGGGRRRGRIRPRGRLGQLPLRASERWPLQGDRVGKHRQVRREGRRRRRGPAAVRSDCPDGDRHARPRHGERAAVGATRGSAHHGVRHELLRHRADGDSGAYSLHDVPSGVVRLQAMTSLLSGRSTTRTVEVPDGGDFQADIAFQGASRLAGRVTRGDRPLSGLFVNALPIRRAPTPAAPPARRTTTAAMRWRAWTTGTTRSPSTARASPTAARSRSRATPTATSRCPRSR